MAEAGAAAPKADLVILHFNDVYDVEPAAKEPVGGATRFATALKTLRQEASSPPLVLFSGDVFNPSLLSAITKGKHMVNVMNELHIQASVYGNHEFDFGVEQLRKNVSQCNFPWLMSNLIDTATGLPFAGGHRHLVLPWNGLKVGLIGLVEQEWLVTLAYLPESVEYRDFVTEGQALVEELKDKEGCDLVIALTHMRAPNDNRLAKGVPRLDLILSGHDHFYEVWQEQTHNTTIVKSGTEFRYISQVELFLDSNSPNHKPRVITKKIEVTKEFEEDENMKQILSCFQEMMNTKLNKVIGRTSVMLDARNAFVRTGETNLGSMICDIMRTTMGADVALLNSGTIRSDSSYGPGDIKLKDLMTILPFADTVVVIEVTGQQLWDAFENGVSKWPLQEGRFPQLSGASFVFDPSLPPGRRLLKANIVEGEGEGRSVPLDREKKYLLATKTYLSDGQDGYDCLKDSKMVIDQENGLLLPVMVRHHFMKLKVLSSFKSVRVNQLVRLAFRKKEQVDSVMAIAPTCFGRIVALQGENKAEEVKKDKEKEEEAGRRKKEEEEAQRKKQEESERAVAAMTKEQLQQRVLQLERENETLRQRLLQQSSSSSSAQ
ncbi:Snake venom 5'-nucleotidase [Balamuthia mandrillaris]